MENYIKAGNVKMVKQMFKNGKVDFSDYNDDGETPLMLVIKY